MATDNRRTLGVVGREFNNMLEQASMNNWEPKCYDRPDIFTDFAVPPPPDRCAEACAGCPMLVLCREYALLARPKWGIQGGIAWNKGKQAHLDLEVFTPDEKIVTN